MIMIPVGPALLMPEPDSVHELMDHNASVNAARSQWNLQKFHWFSLSDTVNRKPTPTCCLFPHLPTELLHPLPFMMWMKSFSLLRGTNWKEVCSRPLFCCWLQNAKTQRSFSISTPCMSKQYHTQIQLALMQVFFLYSLMAFAMTPRSFVLNELAIVYGTTPPGHLELYGKSQIILK